MDATFIFVHYRQCFVVEVLVPYLVEKNGYFTPFSRLYEVYPLVDIHVLTHRSERMDVASTFSPPHPDYHLIDFIILHTKQKDRDWHPSSLRGMDAGIHFTSTVCRPAKLFLLHSFVAPRLQCSMCGTSRSKKYFISIILETTVLSTQSYKILISLKTARCPVPQKIRSSKEMAALYKGWLIQPCVAIHDAIPPVSLIQVSCQTR